MAEGPRQLERTAGDDVTSIHESAQARIVRAQGTATGLARLAEDPTLPDDLRAVLRASATDAKRTANGVERLVADGHRSLIIAIVAVVVAIVAPGVTFILSR